MNMKLNNEETPPEEAPGAPEPASYSSAEERRRTGRYVATIVGISLVCLAMYHAWVRKVPVLASLLVPALIMLLYIGWVLYTASRDRRRELEAGGEAEGAVPPDAAPGAPAAGPGPPADAATAARTTPKRPNDPGEFRRCHSIA